MEINSFDNYTEYNDIERGEVNQNMQEDVNIEPSTTVKCINISKLFLTLATGFAAGSSAMYGFICFAGHDEPFKECPSFEGPPLALMIFVGAIVMGVLGTSVKCAVLPKRFEISLCGYTIRC